MVLMGSGSYIYYGTSSTYKGENRAVDKHQAFNPMLASVAFPEDMKYVIKKHTTMNKLYHNIEFDEKLEEGTVSFKCMLRDPIPMATLFTYKGLPTSWSGTADMMTYNFSALTNEDENIWVQIHDHDQTGECNHLNIFLDGGKMVSYKWVIEGEEIVGEDFEIKFAEIAFTEYPPDIDDGFDDESFNKTGVKEICTITALAANDITTNTYFLIQAISSAWLRTNYHVWFNKDAGGVDPAPSGSTGIEVAITTDGSAGTVATAIGAALDAASADFGTPSVTEAVITVTINNKGDVKDVVDVDSGLTVAATTQGVVDVDGGWSNWDAAYTSKKAVESVDCIITFNSVAFPDLDIQGAEIEFLAPTETYRVQESLTVQGSYLAVRGPWKATVKGILTKGNDNMLEPSLVIASKDQQTFKVQYGTTKYAQFTLGRIENVSSGGVEAGKPVEASFDIVGGADSVASFSWTANEATDPSAHINHTDV